MSRNENRTGFTLIELLVVIAVIALLVGILAPSLAAARAMARETKCLTQMRELGKATHFYAGDNNELLPRSTHSAIAYRWRPWGYALCQYLTGAPYTGPGVAWDQAFNGIYRCPQDRRRDNSWSFGKSVWTELTAEEITDAIAKPAPQAYPRLTDVPRPAATVFFGELGSGSMADHFMAHFWYMGGEPEVDKHRHGKRSNYVTLDTRSSPAIFDTTFDLARGTDQWYPDNAR